MDDAVHSFTMPPRQLAHCSRNVALKQSTGLFFNARAPLGLPAKAGQASPPSFSYEKSHWNQIKATAKILSAPALPMLQLAHCSRNVARKQSTGLFFNARSPRWAPRQGGINFSPKFFLRKKPLFLVACRRCRSSSWARTKDPLINSQML